MFLFSFFWFLNYGLGTIVQGSINLTNEKNHINGHLENLGNIIGEKYFSNLKCVLVMSDPGLLENLKIANVSIVNIEINSTNENCVEDLADILRITFNDNCNGYIIQFINPICALKGWVEINQHSSIARHNPKFFFLPVYPQLLTYGDELLSVRESDITANFLVSEIYENSSEWFVVLSTNNFYEHPTVPGRIPKLYMDEWHYQSGFKENVDLYPDKVSDLRGKIFRVATSKYLPFSSPDPFDGAEIRIAKRFCEKFNCTPVPVTDDSLWGGIYEDLTADGVLGNIYNDKADVGEMAVYLWLHEWYYIDYTHSTLAADVTVLLPKPKKLSAWILPFLPFKIDMWIALFISLVLSASSLYIITKASIRFTRFRDLLIQKVQFTTIEDSSLRAIGLVVLQQPSSRLIGDSPNRYLFTSFEFLYLVLSAMYSAELSSFLTIPLYYPPIDKFHDFAQSGIPWYGTNSAWTYALERADEEDAKLIVDHFTVLPMDQLKKKIKEGKYGFTVERLPGGTMSEQDHETTDVIPMYHIMKEKLFGSPLVASIKKGSPYLKHYNEVMFEAVEYGHFLYWEGDVARKYLNSRLQSALNEAKTVHIDSSPAVIQISNIQGILLIYAFGTTVSIVVFFAEIIKYKRFNLIKC